MCCSLCLQEADYGSQLVTDALFNCALDLVIVSVGEVEYSPPHLIDFGQTGNF